MRPPIVVAGYGGIAKVKQQKEFSVPVRILQYPGKNLPYGGKKWSDIFIPLKAAVPWMDRGCAL